MLKSAVYLNNSFIGEVDVYYTTSWMKEIRISHFSQSSERCFPLAILHSISKDGICFKLESKIPSVELLACYSTCLRENKTAVVALGDEELHLVALPSRNNLMQCSFFWGFRVSHGLYNSSMVMLNLRCLSIVFDLDETLIVANTTRSFEDKINILQQKISMETDPHRIALMIAEVKRYQEDKHMLKQYVENDQVLDDGVLYKAQLEVVQPLTGSHQPLSRPIIRLQEKNIILTRVNPEIRDTSILVRLRPAWIDLRSYLTARGRKRFEVFVCTMAEREYALEMWRLLDPQSQLISYEEIFDRIVCVKSGMKKSLLDVFQGGICNPKLGLVIDDRLNVWDENDKLRVHVVPAFAPYYAPLAEEDNMIPILRVARNVVCNVRGKFFKEFDEDLLPRFANICYEDEIIDLPHAPDVSNYLVTEGNACALNVSKDPVGLERISDGEAERRMKDARYITQSYPPITNGSGYDLMSTTSSVLSVITSLRRVIKPVSSPVIEEEGEVHEMELDPDTRRRLLILQHGQDDSSSSPPPPAAAFPFRSPPIQIPVTSSQPHVNWLPLEDGMMPPWQAKKLRKEFALKPEKYFGRKLTNRVSFVRGNDYDHDRGCDRFNYENHKLPPEAHYGEYQKRRKRPMSSRISYSGEEKPITNFPSSRRYDRFESRHPVARYRDDKLEALQNIARDAGGGKVEFTTDVCDTIELQFIVEAWFVGDKVGEGIGRTRKEAQLNAAMEALDTLTNTYIAPNMTGKQKMRRKLSHSQENNTSDPVPVKKAIKESTPSVITLKELCITKGYTLHFLVKSSTSAGSDDEEKAQYCAQVEIAGQIMGSGTGKTWEEAKTQAAEKALDSLQSLQGQFAQKCPCSNSSR